MDVVLAWQTPRGRPVAMTVRESTSDYNTANSILAHDEYRLGELILDGWALDIGAHIGGATVALALDNPNLRVVAVEPVPDNVRLLRLNVEANGIADRVTIVDGAACGLGDKTADVWYGYQGDETATHHAFIGNSSLAYDHAGELPHETREAPCSSLPDLLKLTDTGEFSFAKLDCEGCEYAVLDCGCARHIAIIRGEYHGVRGQGRAEILRALDLTHVVTFPGPADEGTGAFEAVRRG